MGLATNVVAAALLALSIAFYVFVYTIWLKRRTPQNIVIGGAAGAFPPVIGWAAVTGSRRRAAAADVRHHLLLDAAAFLGAVAVGAAATTSVPACRCCRWWPARAETRRQSWSTRWLLVPLSLVPWAACTSPAWSTGLAAAVLGLGFIASAWRVLRDRQDAAGVSLTNDAPAKRLFSYSHLLPVRAVRRAGRRSAGGMMAVTSRRKPVPLSRDESDALASGGAAATSAMLLVLVAIVGAVLRHRHREDGASPTPRLRAGHRKRIDALAMTARNCRVASGIASLAVVVLGMVGLSFAAVPLYRAVLRRHRLWRHAADRPRAEPRRRPTEPSPCASTPTPTPTCRGISSPSRSR